METIIILGLRHKLYKTSATECQYEPQPPQYIALIEGNSRARRDP